MNLFPVLPKAEDVFQLKEGMVEGGGLLDFVADPDAEDAEGAVYVKSWLNLGKE